MVLRVWRASWMLYLFSASGRLSKVTKHGWYLKKSVLLNVIRGTFLNLKLSHMSISSLMAP